MIYWHPDRQWLGETANCIDDVLAWGGLRRPIYFSRGAWRQSDVVWLKPTAMMLVRQLRAQRRVIATLYKFTIH
jgi:hypothetical protein